MKTKVLRLEHKDGSPVKIGDLVTRESDGARLLVAGWIIPAEGYPGSVYASPNGAIAGDGYHAATLGLRWSERTIQEDAL